MINNFFSTIIKKKVYFKFICACAIEAILLLKKNEKQKIGNV